MREEHGALPPHATWEDAPKRGVVVANGGSGSAVTHVRTREAVAALLAQGMSHTDAARRLGLAKATISYHARRLGRDVDERAARRYDWPAIQAFYDAGRSVRECVAQFGFCVADVDRGRTHLKTRLLAAGSIEQRCSACGISDWRGIPLRSASQTRCWP